MQKFDWMLLPVMIPVAFIWLGIAVAIVWALVSCFIEPLKSLRNRLDDFRWELIVDRRRELTKERRKEQEELQKQCIKELSAEKITPEEFMNQFENPEIDIELTAYEEKLMKWQKRFWVTAVVFWIYLWVAMILAITSIMLMNQK
jgi:uncharacterized membrane protein YhiD involved in acid resistance